MKTYFFLFIIFPFVAHCQSNSNDSLKKILYESGSQFRKYARQENSSYYLEIAGGLCVGAGLVINDQNNNNRPVIITGIAAGLLGFILQATAASHINKAGIILQGNGLSINLNQKHHKEIALN